MSRQAMQENAVSVRKTSRNGKGSSKTLCVGLGYLGNPDSVRVEYLDGKIVIEASSKVKP